jgi:hypothetical protein
MAVINKSTGEIQFPGEPWAFGPATMREDFVLSAIGRQSQPASRIHNDSFTLPKVEIRGHPFYRILYFLGGCLHQMFMGSTHVQFGQSWNDWSREKEMARKRFHDSLLAEIFGEVKERYEFPWGSVASYYDIKGDASQIVITYEA